MPCTMLTNTPPPVKANAKVNLALRITRRRSDGYHNLSTLFQEIDLHDNLWFKPASTLRLTTTMPELATDESNLCTRAYNTFKKLISSPPAYAIHLEKNIPLGAGLGGGSADAAAVLKFLNTAWQINLGIQALQKIAAEVGSDVPFYINGGTQGATGRGEILTPLRPPDNFVLLLVIPPLAISTAWAYQQFNPADCKPPYDFDDFTRGKRIHWELCENQFESIVFQHYPELKAIKIGLQKNGARYAALTGSGSALFGVFDTAKEAQSASQNFSAYQTFVARPVLR